MKKITRILLIAAVLSVLHAVTAFAGSWQYNGYGWWWDNGDGTWPAGGWAWCDGNNDGVAECYYFDGSGYCLLDTVTPDGYRVNANGAWVENGQVQTQYVGAQQSAVQYSYSSGQVYQDASQGAQDQGYQTYGQTSQGRSSGQRYELQGWQSVSTQEDGVEYGYLELYDNGTGVIRIGEADREYKLNWSRSEDEIHLKYGYSNYTAYCYDELGQIRLAVGDYVYYFEAR